MDGRVIEQWSRRPVNGALVNVNGYLATADLKGNFSVPVTSPTATITVTHKDYETYSGIVTDTGTVEVQLKPIAKALCHTSLT